MLVYSQETITFPRAFKKMKASNQPIGIFLHRVNLLETLKAKEFSQTKVTECLHMSVKVKAKPWGAAGWETCTEKQNANCIFRTKQQNVWKHWGYEELFCVLTTGPSSVNVWWMFFLSQKKGLRCQKQTSPMGKSELCTFKKHVLEPVSQKNYFVALCLHKHEPKTTWITFLKHHFH